MEIRRLLILTITVVFILFLSQCSVFRYTKPLSPSPDVKVVENVCHLNSSGACRFQSIKTGTNILVTEENSVDAIKEKVREKVVDLVSQTDSSLNKEFSQETGGDVLKSSILTDDNQTDDSVIRKTTADFSFSPLRNGDVSVKNYTSAEGRKPSRSSKKLDNTTVKRDKTAVFNLLDLNRPLISISQMYAKLSEIHKFSCLKRRSRCGQTSQRNRELQYARLEIEKVFALMSPTELSASVFRNVSKFIRSYELMEKMFKVYIYKEGEKPIFHQPLLTGIYASEGWFMKLLEENKKFIVKDPEEAHLFYLPFSSQFLRWAFGKNFHNKRDLQKLLKKYIDLIAKKYRFWNRNGGSDHFLVACHDWASKLTRRFTKNCIRSLCNANAATDFEFGKDTSLPVTFIHSIENPVKNIGGKPPTERTTLAFFAGNMHGYLRPILLHYWENKELDMKIAGPMQNGSEGERAYMEQMKSSKFCICARGYQVHTPRVIEAILYECIPVIISDNYVPPFFEVLNWESFAVFVEEREIPKLRDILLSIPEENYLAMHSRLKMVQKHFLWHEKAAKYDVFHMILHSIWYTRVFQMKSH